MSTPYSWSCKKFPKDAEDQAEAALGAVSALRQVHGTVFTVRLRLLRYTAAPTS